MDSGLFGKTRSNWMPDRALKQLTHGPRVSTRCTWNVTASKQYETKRYYLLDVVGQAFDLGPRHGPGWHRERITIISRNVRKHRLAQYVSNQENRVAPTKSKLGRLFADVVQEIPDQTNQSARDHWLWYLSYNIKFNHNKALAKQWRERKNKELESKRSISSSSSPPPAVPTRDVKIEYYWTERERQRL